MPPSFISAVDRRGPALLVALVALASAVAVGCGGDDESGASSASAAVVSSSSSSTTSTASTAGSTSTGGEDEEGELPPGCDDGVQVKGEFCFRRIALPELCESPSFGDGGRGHRVGNVVGLDVHGEGRTSLLANCSGDTGVQGGVVAWLFDGEGFEQGPTSLDTNAGAGGPHIDFDGDGLPDIVGGQGTGGIARVSMKRNLGGGLVGPSETVLEIVIGGSNIWVGGQPIVVDVDGDGTYEILAGEQEPGSRLYRDDPLVGWQPVGPHIDLPGCNVKGVSVVGDFDEDGYPDAVVDVSGTYCDHPWSFEYHPDWHRFALFRSNPGTGLLDLVDTMPSGVVLSTGYHFPIVADVDHDGHLDAVFQSTPGAVLLHGRGDGTFDDARVIPRELPDAMGSWWLGNRGHGADFDGDGAVEFLGVVETADAGNVLAFVQDVAAKVTVTLREPPFAGSGGSLGDVNGDAIDDFLGYESGADAPRYLFVSVS